MGTLKKEYGFVFIFPGPVGTLLATALKRAGRDVLIINHPGEKFPAAPDIIGASLYFPDAFVQSITEFGFPEPEYGDREPLCFYIGRARITIDPDSVRQIMDMAHAMPGLDRRLMDMVMRLKDKYNRIAPRLESMYLSSPGKLALGRRLMRDGVLGLFKRDPLARLPDDGEGLIAKWAIALPGYLALGLQAPSAGLRALAVGFGLRCPRICSLNASKLTVDAEHLYLNEGGDAIEAAKNALIDVKFVSGTGGSIRVNGSDIQFGRALLPKDVAAKAFVGREGLHTHLHGLTLLTRSFTWTPPPRFDPSGPRHGLILSDPIRPPINDNLVIYSIGESGAGGYPVKLGIAVERAETLFEHFVDKRRDHLIARMAADFMTKLGGELSLEQRRPPRPPPLKVTGRGRFRFYTDNLMPGNTLEDLIRHAQWLSTRVEFRRP